MYVSIPGTCLLGLTDLTSNASMSAITGQSAGVAVSEGDHIIWLVTDRAGTGYDPGDHQFDWNGTVTRAGVTLPDMTDVFADPASFDGKLPADSRGAYTRKITIYDALGNRVCDTGELDIAIQ